jgi:hypothetical protein
MLGCIEGAGRRGIKREKSTRSPRFLKWPLEVEEDMAEREHRASKAGKTGITEHNEQCTRIQKGSDMTDEDKRDLNNRIAFYEWKDLQRGSGSLLAALDNPKAKAGALELFDGSLIRLREVHLSLDILGKST